MPLTEERVREIAGYPGIPAGARVEYGLAPYWDHILVERQQLAADWLALRQQVKEMESRGNAAADPEELREALSLADQNAALRAMVEEALGQCECNYDHPGCSGCANIRARLAALGET